MSGYHFIGRDLGLHRQKDWIDRIDWADLELYLAKHWAFLEYLDATDQAEG